MDVVIREAAVDDLLKAGQLWEKMDDYHRTLGFTFPKVPESAQKWADGYRRTLGRFSFIWLAEYAGKIEGMLSGRLKQSAAHLGAVQVGELNDLFVGEAVRGMGVASRLVETAEKKFSEFNVHSIELHIMVKNENSQRLWAKLGYSPDLLMVRKVL